MEQLSKTIKVSLEESTAALAALKAEEAQIKDNIESLGRQEAEARERLAVLQEQAVTLGADKGCSLPPEMTAYSRFLDRVKYQSGLGGEQGVRAYGYYHNLLVGQVTQLLHDRDEVTRELRLLTDRYQKANSFMQERDLDLSLDSELMTLGHIEMEARRLTAICEGKKTELNKIGKQYDYLWSEAQATAKELSRLRNAVASEYSESQW